MTFIFQAHDYSVNHAACEESCTLWTEHLEDEIAAHELLRELSAAHADEDISFSFRSPS